MESLGSILKTAREGKGYTIEQVARETNIAKRYISALEDEDVTIFPGETYFIGFLRNYSEFLGQDADKLIALYKNMKIQEQPAPMEELLTPRRSRPMPVILIIIVAVAVLGALFWFLVLPGMEKRSRMSAESATQSAAEAAAESSPEKSASVPAGEGTRYDFKEEILERGFLAGDTIVVYGDFGQYPLTIMEIGETIFMDAAGRPLELVVETSSLLDFDQDGVNDLKILPRRILDNGAGVVLYLDKYVESSDPFVRDSDALSPADAGTPAAAPSVGTGIGTVTTPVTAAVIGTAGTASRASREVVLLEEDSPRGFDLDVVFRGLCLLRYVADNNSREERYFHKGEVFKLEANREIRLWISNAGSFKGRVGGVDIPLGNPGEVATKLIRWEKNDASGKYQLKLIPVY